MHNFLTHSHGLLQKRAALNKYGVNSVVEIQNKRYRDLLTENGKRSFSVRRYNKY